MKDNNGRSVIKVTHEPLPAAFFEASDSEDDDSDIEGDLPSDEFELDSEEGFRKIVKEAKEAQANGDIPAEDDDEDDDFEDDEDEDEDDEDMDSEDDDDELLETTVLCALTAGKVGLSFNSPSDADVADRAGQPKHHLYRGRCRHVRGHR